MHEHVKNGSFGAPMLFVICYLSCSGPRLRESDPPKHDGLKTTCPILTQKNTKTTNTPNFTHVQGGSLGVKKGHFPCRAGKDDGRFRPPSPSPTSFPQIAPTLAIPPTIYRARCPSSGKLLWRLPEKLLGKLGVQQFPLCQQFP